MTAYIDSLMTKVGEMGALITTSTGGRSLRSRLSLTGRRRAVQLSDHVGGLQVPPQAPAHALGAI